MSSSSLSSFHIIRLLLCITMGDGGSDSSTSFCSCSWLNCHRTLFLDFTHKPVSGESSDWIEMRGIGCDSCCVLAGVFMGVFKMPLSAIGAARSPARESKMACCRRLASSFGSSSSISGTKGVPGRTSSDSGTWELVTGKSSPPKPVSSSKSSKLSGAGGCTEVAEGFFNHGMTLAGDELDVRS